jgi:hypothetical protein
VIWTAAYEQTEQEEGADAACPAARLRALHLDPQRNPTAPSQLPRGRRTPLDTGPRLHRESGPLGPQGVGKVRYVRPDLRRWQAEARIGSLGRPCGSLPAR